MKPASLAKLKAAKAQRTIGGAPARGLQPES